MRPSVAMKHLYAAFAENPSCGGASYYEDAMKCGGVDDAAADFSEENNGAVAKKSTFDGSLEVGIRPDGEVFGPSSSSSAPSPSRKSSRKNSKQDASTPDTSPESYADSGEGEEYVIGNVSGSGPHLPSLNSKHHQDYTPSAAVGAHHHYGGPIMKKSTFPSNASNDGSSRSGGGGSKNTRSTTPDSIERARGVTFRDETKRIPKSVNATLSKSSSTLSRDEGEMRSGSPAGNTASLAGLGRLVTSCPTDEQCSPKPLSSSPSPSPRPSPTDIKFVYGQLNIQDTCNVVSSSNGSVNLAMFTKEDLEAITSLQISTYLSINERKKIGTKVLTAKLGNGGYNLASGHNLCCDSCKMPMLSKSGKVVDSCVVCPVLKKRVLKKILEGASKNASSASVDSSIDTNTTSGSIDLSQQGPMSDSKADYGRDLVHSSPAAMKSIAFVASNAAGEEVIPNDTSGVDDQDDTYYLNDQTFILEAKKSLIVDIFNTKAYYDALKSPFSKFSCQEMQFKDGKDAVDHAREVLAKKVVLASEVLVDQSSKCQPQHNGGLEAVAYAGEMMVSRAALVPEAMKYKENNMNISCKGLEFKGVKDATAHLAELFPKNVSCLPTDGMNCEGNVVNYLVVENVEKEESDELTNDVGAFLDQDEEDDQQEQEDKIILEDARANAEGPATNALLVQDIQDDQYDQDEKIIVEDASADAEDCPLNDPAKTNESRQLQSQVDHGEKANEDEVTSKSKDVQENKLLNNGLEVTQTQTQPQKDKREEDVIEQAYQPPLASISAPSPAMEARLLPLPASPARQISEASDQQQSPPPSSPESVVSGLSNGAQSAVSNTLISMLEQTE